MTRVPAQVMRSVMVEALKRRGVAHDHAEVVADALVDTSLRGVDTHGVRLFPVYLRELDGGRAVVAPAIRCTESGALAVVDAGGALGIVAGTVAADHAVRLARSLGVGFVTVRNSNHFGAAAIYSRAIAKHGMVGLSFSNSDALVAPFAGSRALFGTNPLSLAVGGIGEDELCIDMATSQVSYSRVLAERRAGRPLPHGWALADDGTDAAERPDAAPSALQPLGGYKGQCLAILVEVLCAALADGPFDHELSHLYDPPFDEPRGVSHAMLAIDATRHVSLERLQARVTALLRTIRAAPAAGDAVEAPGDPEQRCFADRQARGIPLDGDTLPAFRAIADESPSPASSLFTSAIDRDAAP